VHYPNCRRKCGYCDFATVVETDFDDRAYVDSLIAEMQGRAQDYSEAGDLHSIFFGGGTPSLCPAAELARVIDAARETFSFASYVEITVEANPGTVDAEAFAALKRAGVNRLSFGIQSLDDELLRRLTRIHDSAAAVSAFGLAREAGFENISCDLIFGIHGQKLESHLEQVAAFISLGPEHLSTYALTLSETSPLYRQGKRPASSDLSAEMMSRGRALLVNAGFEHYEVSNFARPGRPCLHNSMVWQGYPYLGLGPAAHSLVGNGPFGGFRLANPGLKTFLEADWDGGPPRHLRRTQVEPVDMQTLAYEGLFLGLRLNSGVDRALFRSRFGYDPADRFGEAFQELEAAGLIELGPDRIRPTLRGLYFADDVALRLGR